jgi:small-conductance mechanosensitive channel
MGPAMKQVSTAAAKQSRNISRQELKIEELSERICEYNDRMEALAQSSYPQVELLKHIKGVDTLVGLTFLLTLEDPRHVRNLS